MKKHIFILLISSTAMAPLSALAQCPDCGTNCEFTYQEGPNGPSGVGQDASNVVSLNPATNTGIIADHYQEFTTLNHSHGPLKIFSGCDLYLESKGNTNSFTDGAFSSVAVNNLFSSSASFLSSAPNNSFSSSTKFKSTAPAHEFATSSISNALAINSNGQVGIHTNNMHAPFTINNERSINFGQVGGSSSIFGSWIGFNSVVNSNVNPATFNKVASGGTSGGDMQGSVVMHAGYYGDFYIQTYRKTTGTPTDPQSGILWNPQFTFKNDGVLQLASLSGTGNRMVITDANGNLSSQSIPVGDNLGNHTASQSLNLGGNQLTNVGLFSWQGGTGTINGSTSIGTNLTVANDLIVTNGDITVNGFGVSDFHNTLEIDGAFNTVTMSGNVVIEDFGSINASLTLDGNGFIVSGSNWTTSDARYKKNIATIENALDKVTSLRGVDYSFNTDTYPGLAGSKSIGFIAQEVMEVFPELVYQNDSGFYAVNYEGVIPVLVEAIRELKTELELVKASGNPTNNSTGDPTDNPSGGDPGQGNSDRGSLFQNYPNPFDHETTIQYSIPEQTNNASIMITDLAGKTVKTVLLTQTGTASVKVSTEGLYPGVFLYLLLIGNDAVDSKQMVIR